MREKECLSLTGERVKAAVNEIWCRLMNSTDTRLVLVREIDRWPASNQRANALRIRYRQSLRLLLLLLLLLQLLLQELLLLMHANLVLRNTPNDRSRQVFVPVFDDQYTFTHTHK